MSQELKYSHIQALSRHSDKIATDGQVCFLDGFLLALQSHEEPTKLPGGTKRH